MSLLCEDRLHFSASLHRLLQGTVKAFITRAGEVNHSVLLNSSLRYVLKWLAGGIQLSQNLFWQPPCPQCFPQDLGINFMIIFTHIKATALTKRLIIGLWVLSFKLLRYGLCHVHLRKGLQVLSSQVQQKLHLMGVVFQKKWLTALWNHTPAICGISGLLAMAINPVTIWILDFKNRTECKYSTKEKKWIKLPLISISLTKYACVCNGTQLGVQD